MPFDLPTLHLSSLLSRGAYLAVFLLVAARQPGELCLRHWIGAIFSSLAGSALMMSIPPDRWLTPTEALAVYTSYSASLTLSWSGLMLFNRRQVKLSVLALMTMAPGIVYILALSIGVPSRFALAAVFAFCIGYGTMGSFEAVNRPRDRQLWSAYMVSGTLGLYATMLFATFVLLVATDIPMNSSESARMSMIVDQAAGILIYFSYIAMANERAILTIEHIAETDTLTGLGNRRGLQRALARLDMPRSQETHAGVLLADIDKFKVINDTHGHLAGDAVLVGFSARLRSALRDSDIVVRWGGEEFLAILPTTDDELLMTIAERVRRAVEAAPFDLPGGGAITVTVSIGVSTMAMRADAFEQAARRADAALYDAKTAGRNRICGIPPFPVSPSPGYAA